MLSAALNTGRDSWKSLLSACSDIKKSLPSQLIHSAHDAIRSPYVALAICAVWFAALPAVRSHHLREARLSTYVTAVAAWDAFVARLLAEHRAVLVPAVGDRLMRMAMEEADDEDDEEFQDIEEEEEEEEEGEGGEEKTAAVDSDEHKSTSSTSNNEEDCEALYDRDLVALVLEMPLSTFGTIQLDEDGAGDLVARFSRICAEDFQEEDDDEEDVDSGAFGTGHDEGADDPTRQTLVDFEVPFDMMIVTPSSPTQQSMLYRACRVSKSSTNNDSGSSGGGGGSASDNLMHELSSSLQSSTAKHTVLVPLGFLRGLDLGEVVRLTSFLAQNLVQNQRGNNSSSSSRNGAFSSSSSSAAEEEEENTAASICRDMFRICFAVLAAKHLAMERAHVAFTARQDKAKGDAAAADSAAGSARQGVAEAEEESEADSLRRRKYQFGREISHLIGRLAHDCFGSDGFYFAREMCFEDTVCIFGNVSPAPTASPGQNGGAVEKKKEEAELVKLSNSIVSFAHMCRQNNNDEAVGAHVLSQLSRAVAFSDSTIVNSEAFFRLHDKSRLKLAAMWVVRQARYLCTGALVDCVPLVGQWPMLRQGMRWIPPAVLLSNLAVQIGLALLSGVSEVSYERQAEHAYAQISDEDGNSVGEGGAVFLAFEEDDFPQRPFPPLIEALSHSALKLQNIFAIAQLVLRAANNAGDRSVSTKMFLYAATADFGAGGVSKIFRRAASALAVVPRLAQSLSWAVHEPAKSMGVMLQIWRHPGLIALYLCIVRCKVLLLDQQNVAQSSSRYFTWLEARVAEKRKRRIRTAVRAAAASAVKLLFLSEQQQEKEKSGTVDNVANATTMASTTSAIPMVCLDPQFCEPLAVPTRGDDPHLAGSSAFGARQNHDENEDDDDDENSDQGSSQSNSSSSSSSTGKDVQQEAETGLNAPASAPSEASGLLHNGGGGGGGEGNEENNDEEEEDGADDPWIFPQPDIGISLLDANSKQERSLRCATLGLALLACAIAERHSCSKGDDVSASNNNHHAAATAAAAASSSASTTKTAKRKKSSSKRQQQLQWVNIPLSTSPSFFLNHGSAGSGGVLSNVVRWPTTPLHINKFLSPFINLLHPSHSAVHDATGGAIQEQVNLILNRMQQQQRDEAAAAAAKKTATATDSETQQQLSLQVAAASSFPSPAPAPVASPARFARYVVGRRYSLAPTASTLASLFDSKRFRAMRLAGFEVETVVASSSALLARTSEQLGDSAEFNKTMTDDTRLAYTITDGAEQAVYNLASKAHRRIFPPLPPAHQGDRDHEDGSHNYYEDPRVALHVLECNVSAQSLTSLDGAGAVAPGHFVVGDESEFELALANDRAQQTGGMMQMFDENLTADVLSNPIPSTTTTTTSTTSIINHSNSSSSSSSSDPICSWLARETRSQRTIDGNTCATNNSGNSSIGGNTDHLAATRDFDWEFRDVYFAYPSDPERFVLHRLSFKLPAHSFVGIVGVSGSGKTTVLALMLRLYEPTRGEILLNGRSLRDYAPRWLRRHLAYVGPLCALLGGESGNAVDEVASASPMASDAQVVQALCDAMVPARMFDSSSSLSSPSTAIQQQKEAASGRDNNINNNNNNNALPTISTMSGGEAQRVQIARAFVKMQQPATSSSSSSDAGNCAIISLLFDEGTSSLDSKTEEHVVRAIEGDGGKNSKSTRPTRVCVAHRIFTVRDCDMLLIVYRGRLVAQGTFFECLRAAQRVVDKKTAPGAGTKTSTTVSATTLRGLRWFLHSVKAQALRDEKELPDLDAVVPTDDGNGHVVNQQQQDDGSEASDADEEQAEEQQEEADYDEEDGDSDDALGTKNLLSALHSLPADQQILFQEAVRRQLGGEAGEAWMRLSKQRAESR